MLFVFCISDRESERTGDLASTIYPFIRVSDIYVNTCVNLCVCGVLFIIEITYVVPVHCLEFSGNNRVL